MSNTFGSNFKVTLFGESHNKKIGCVIDGVAPGVEIDLNFIKKRLSQRTTKYSLRKESDNFEILSGVYNGYSTGTPICIEIENNDIKSGDYSILEDMPRPGHADYTNHVKYLGYENPLGGGHSSGRLTAPIVVAGAIAELELKQYGIEIATHISQIYTLKDRKFSDFNSDISFLQNAEIGFLDSTKINELDDLVKNIETKKDSIGGILETAIIGMPVGVGEPWFDSIESKISSIIYSIPAVKGIAFGTGFEFANKLGSEVKDEFYYDKSVKTYTNNNGGINGGISNGMPIIFSTVIKPTPSIGQPQKTVDYVFCNEKEITISGRHDISIVPKANIVITTATAIAIADLMTTKYGTNWPLKD